MQPVRAVVPVGAASGAAPAAAAALHVRGVRRRVRRTHAARGAQGDAGPLVRLRAAGEEELRRGGRGGRRGGRGGRAGGAPCVPGPRGRAAPAAALMLGGMLPAAAHPLLPHAVKDTPEERELSSERCAEKGLRKWVHNSHPF